MAAAEERFLSTEEVAERLQVDEQTVRRWIKSGKLEAVKPGREWRIPPTAFEALLESYSSPKAQAPLPLDSGEERGGYPYPWMGDTLETLISTWEWQAEEQHNPAQSRTIMVAALDVQDAVTFNYRGRWETLSEQEKSERKELAGRLETLAMRGIDHYKESKKAEVAELEAVERRREEIRAATKRLSA